MTSRGPDTAKPLRGETGGANEANTAKPKPFEPRKNGGLAKLTLKGVLSYALGDQ